MPKTYAREIRMAKRLIRRYGQAKETVTWRQVTDGAPPDSSKPWKGGPTVTNDIPVEMVFLPEDEKNFRVKQYVRDTVIPETFEIGLMAGRSDFSPEAKDTVIRDDIVYTIWYLDTLRPNGINILHTIGLKL